MRVSERTRRTKDAVCPESGCEWGIKRPKLLCRVHYEIQKNREKCAIEGCDGVRRNMVAESLCSLHQGRKALGWSYPYAVNPNVIPGDLVAALINMWISADPPVTSGWGGEWTGRTIMVLSELSGIGERRLRAIRDSETKNVTTRLVDRLLIAMDYQHEWHLSLAGFSAGLDDGGEE